MYGSPLLDILVKFRGEYVAKSKYVIIFFVYLFSIESFFCVVNFPKTIFSSFNKEKFL